MKADWVIGKNSNLNIGQGSCLHISGNVEVDSNATINNEGKISFTGEINNNGILTNPGEISTTKILSNVINYNVGNLGAVITTIADLGETTIAWGGTAQIIDDSVSISRYYEITPANNTGLDATFEFTYLQPEAVNKHEIDLALYRSENAGATWVNYEGLVDSVLNKITITGLNAFSRWTAATTVPFVKLRNDYKHCIDVIDTLTALITGGTPPFNYLWSTGENTESIYINPYVDTTFWVEITDYYGLQSSDTINVFIQNVYEAEEICMVTVDSASQRNMIIWEKTPGQGTAFYKIYRVPNVIDTVPYDSLSISIDYVADPLSQAWQYQITVVDSCDNESSLSPVHQTIHLTAVSDLSGNVTLNWTEYIGFFYQYYYIYRGESFYDLNLIDSVYYTYPKVYTDVNPPPFDIYYRVMVRKHPDSICNPLAGKAASGPFKQSLSNIGDGGIDYQFQVTTYLEGPFHNEQMLVNDKFWEIIPRTQPFNSYPWFYQGEEQVDSVPYGIVDWILFELRKTPYGPWTADSSTIVYRKASFINEYGYLVDLDGLSNLQVNSVLSENVHIVLYHRNHISIMSEIPLNLGNTTLSYNFTNDPDKIHGNSAGYKEILPGIYGMIAGDLNRDGHINGNEIDSCWSMTAGRSGYLYEDLNFDGEINNIDKNDYWLPNIGKGSQVPE